LGGRKGICPVKNGGWWRWALVSLDGVAPSLMVSVSASVNLPLHCKVQKFNSGTGSPGWSRKKGRKMVVVVWYCVIAPPPPFRFDIRFPGEPGVAGSSSVSSSTHSGRDLLGISSMGFLYKPDVLFSPNNHFQSTGGNFKHYWLFIICNTVICNADIVKQGNRR